MPHKTSEKGILTEADPYTTATAKSCMKAVLPAIQADSETMLLFKTYLYIVNDPFSFGFNKEKDKKEHQNLGVSYCMLNDSCRHNWSTPDKKSKQKHTLVETWFSPPNGYLAPSRVLSHTKPTPCRYTHTHTCARTHTHAHTQTHTHRQTDTRVCARARTHTHTYEHRYNGAQADGGCHGNTFMSKNY